MSPEDRRTIVLAEYYEHIVRFGRDWKHNQRNYCNFHEKRDYTKIKATARDRKKFEEFEDIRKWLEKDGWIISHLYLGWKGYIKYLFKRSGEARPTVRMLKNPLVLKEYLRDAVPDLPPPPKLSNEELAKIYFDAIHPNMRKYADRLFK